MARTGAQRAAERALDRALTGMINAHHLVPDNPDALDVIAAYQTVCNSILEGVMEQVREVAGGEKAQESG